MFRGRMNRAGTTVLVLAALALLAGASPLFAGTLIKDDFEDGVVDNTVFLAVGNAIITESNGRLHVQTFGPGDGVEILIPKGTACVQLQTEIPEVEFDQFEAFGVDAMFIDDDGSEVLGAGLEFLRPFWNRCQVTFKLGKDKQTAGFWG